jgi:hypothetical protein
LAVGGTDGGGEMDTIEWFSNGEGGGPKRTYKSPAVRFVCFQTGFWEETMSSILDGTRIKLFVMVHESWVPMRPTYPSFPSVKQLRNRNRHNLCELTTGQFLRKDEDGPISPSTSERKN